MGIFKSASKMVFILIAIGAVTFTAMGILESKDFMVLAGMSFTYYFNRSNTNQK